MYIHYREFEKPSRGLLISSTLRKGPTGSFRMQLLLDQRPLAHNFGPLVGGGDLHLFMSLPDARGDDLAFLRLSK